MSDIIMHPNSAEVSLVAATALPGKQRTKKSTARIAEKPIGLIPPDCPARKSTMPTIA
jgi:hypothetical protein